MSRPAPLLFGDLLYGLRRRGVKVGVAEWMSLLEAFERGAIDPSLESLYFVGRALLIKSEYLFDTWDQTFAEVFGGEVMPVEVVEELLEWLREAKARPELTREQLEELQALDLDTLRQRFEERLAEQTERHDGGSKWVGTGGTSPFGHGGRNPAGVRVGGKGGGRSAIQIATAREFADYRFDRILDTRDLAVALKKLRRLTRRHNRLELDVEKSIDETCKNAGELTLEMSAPRENEARVLLLMDVGGSMDPHAHLVETLFSAAHGLQHWKEMRAYTFHNCPYERLFPARPHDEGPIATADLLRQMPRETFLIFVGDAYMAPSELVDPHGAIDYYHHNATPGIAWIHRLREAFPNCIWLNPMPERAWRAWTIQLVERLVPMYPLTLQGLGDAIEELVRGAPRSETSLETVYPELYHLWTR